MVTAKGGNVCDGGGGEQAGKEEMQAPGSPRYKRGGRASRPEHSGLRAGGRARE